MQTSPDGTYQVRNDGADAVRDRQGQTALDAILEGPFLAVWLVVTMIFVWAEFEIKSMAPPMPLKHLARNYVVCEVTLSADLKIL